MKGRQIRQKMHLLSLEGHRLKKQIIYEKSGDDPGSAVPKGTNLLMVNALFIFIGV